MSDDALKTFKIGDLQRPATPSKSQPAAADAAETPEEPPSSMGFEAIETVLDSVPAEEVAQQLNDVLERLEAHGGDAGNNRAKAEADKAIIAVERTGELLTYLYQTKADIVAEAGKQK